MIAPLLFSPRCLEDRIRSAYIRGRAWSCAAYPQSRVWAAAAGQLVAAHQADPTLPLDPELFVASQPRSAGMADPWGDLTTPLAIGRYRRRVGAIVRQLRRELRAEIRWIRRRLDRGFPLELVLRTRRKSVTPLGRYIIAIQEMREDLALNYLEGAIRQHQNCPLYRSASAGMILDETYPAHQIPGPAAAAGVPLEDFSLN